MAKTRNNKTGGAAGCTQEVGDEPVFETALLLVGKVNLDLVHQQLTRWTNSGCWEDNMTSLVSQISRELARQYGEEAVRIMEEGGYLAPCGRWVYLASAITLAVQGTTPYLPGVEFPLTIPGSFDTQIEVENETTLSAARRLRQSSLNPAVLNFASATHPGGGFLEGARAQEEYLARSTALYACLADQPMYAFHRQRKDTLYTSYMLYSPGVPVFRADDGALLDELYQVGMITAAAPNAVHLPLNRQPEIEQAFRERIAKVLWIGLQHGHDALVLGAWGCGAFGNDGRMVSKLFRESLAQDFRGAYRKVVFAIVDWSEEKKFIGPFSEIISR